MKKILISVLSSVALLISCSQEQVLTLSGLDSQKFVTEVNGAQTGLYTITNANGMEVCITNFGGRVVSIMAPDKDGNMLDVVLGFDNVQSYIDVPSDFGASIGRYANRINDGKFTLDGVEYALPTNNFGHTLHGGPAGWQYQVYEVEEVTPNSIVLVRNSPDGDENFPGNVVATVTYTLTDDNKLDIAYEAETDKPTIINMTHHSYFNLNGDPKNNILDNILWLNADNYTPVDSTYMITGEILPVAGTPMDFTSPKAVGAEIEDFDFEQLKNGNGYDHNWVLNTAGDISQVAAELYSPNTGIVVRVYTDEPGIQFYSGNFLEGNAIGKKGIAYGQRSAVCLETQHYPDSPNKPEWPSVVLRPGETYTSRCIYEFATK
ncbi:MAG: galactose mutarotase [Tidjanibacter sp.]|nr:galactose mutarotase [Tidjanibacter sp.]